MRKTNQSKRRIDGGKAAKIEEKGFGKWESLDKKLMLDIFNRLEPAFLLTTVAWVCRSWGRACYDRFFAEKGEQNTLNLRALHSMSFWNIRINFTKLLRGVMDVYACDNDDDDDYEDGGVRVRVTPITKTMFPSEFVTVTDDHLVYAAKRSPKLRVLSIACGLYIERTGFSRAMQCWSRIEEMTISFSDCDSDNHDVGSIIEVIGINCKKLEVLCLFGLFIGQQLCPEIAKNLKGLKLLRLEECHIEKIGLKYILLKCKKLQKVEIWDCITLNCYELNLFVTCKINKVEVDGVIKWSLVSEEGLYDLKGLLNFLWGSRPPNLKKDLTWWLYKVRTDNHKGCSSPMGKTTSNGCRMCYFKERHNMHDPMIGKYKQWSITRRPIPRKRRSALRDLSFTNFNEEGEFFQEVTAQSEG
ncbi:unnamed protein product [Camellia sinensis]